MVEAHLIWWDKMLAILCTHEFWGYGVYDPSTVTCVIQYMGGS